MKFFILLNSVVCTSDPKLTELDNKAMPFQMNLDIATGQLVTDTTTFFAKLALMFKDDIEKKKQDQIIYGFAKDIDKSRSFETKFGKCNQNLTIIANKIDSFDDPKTMDSATKQQLQESVRKFGDEVSELEKLFKEGQTVKLFAKTVEIFKDKYENNFKPDAIKKVEEYDKCLEKFNTAFKKYLKEGEKPVIELFKYTYNNVSVEVGISMSTTTKWILFVVVGVSCVVVIVVIVVFAYKTYKEHNSRVKEENDEMQYSYIDQSHGYNSNQPSHYQDHHSHQEQPKAGQLENNRNYYN